MSESAGFPSMDTGGVPTGLFVHILDTSVVEMAGLLDVDFVVLDMEHSAATMKTIDELVLAANSQSISTIVRLPGVNPDIARRVLDIGASGVLVPRVSGPGDLRDLREEVLFPPLGARGSCSLTRAADFTLNADSDYHERENDQTSVFGLVELESAVDNLTDILQAEVMDGLVLGPGDLALSMGFAGDLEHATVVERLEHVLTTAQAAGTPVAAYAVSVADGDEWIERGADCIIYSDLRLLRTGIERVVA